MSPAIAVVFYLLLIFCLASLFAGSFTNPGILPRGLQPIPELQPTVVAADGTVQVPQPGAAFEVVQIYTVRGVEVKNRYCYTCSLARPPRVSHCSRCDNCVERFDHRNKIFSFFFLLALVLHLPRPALSPPRVDRLSLGGKLHREAESQVLCPVHLLLHCPGLLCSCLVLGALCGDLPGVSGRRRR